MKSNFSKIIYTAFLFVFVFANIITAQPLTANAGVDKMLCPGGSATIGGGPAATGGRPPYTYTWTPNWYLSSTTAPNPTSTTPSWVEYTLTVVDDTGAVATDKVIVSMSNIAFVDAGNDTSICVNSSAILGKPINSSLPGVTYSWTPTTTLNNPALPRPTASPGLTTTTYSVTMTSTGCPPKTDQVTVTVIPTPIIDAGPDTTINEGQNVTLHATGGFYYAWSPQNTLNYYYTADPDAEPIVTTTYYLYGTDPSNKCPAYDSVTVFVNKSNQIVIYNTITPNGDGENDTWYIGNILKYPNNTVELYNRYGKLVFKTNAYTNTFEGKVTGQELPAGTYFYNINLGEEGDNAKYKGTLTIIR